MEKLPVDLIWLLLTKYIAPCDAIACLRLNKTWLHAAVSRGSLPQLQLSACKTKMARVERLMRGVDSSFLDTIKCAERELKRSQVWVTCDACGEDTQLRGGEVEAVCASEYSRCRIGRHVFCDLCAPSHKCRTCGNFGCKIEDGECWRCRLNMP